MPLSQAAQGCYDKTGTNLFFTRLPFQGSYAKRYQGGTAQNLWKYTSGKEATPMTGDFAGTSKNAMWWNGRVYFLSDRDGTVNLWSMNESGKDLRQPQIFRCVRGSGAQRFRWLAAECVKPKSKMRGRANHQLSLVPCVIVRN